MTLIYLDNNATTPIAPEVVRAMEPYLTAHYFNPSSMYEPAQQVATALKEARATVATFVGASHPDELLFTSCATEANSTAILGAIKANPNRRHIITTEVEHPAVLELCRDLARNGYDVTFLPVDRNGRLDVRDFVRALQPTTLLVTIMHANNETGVLFPIEELARLTKETDPRILFHTDATQSVGKLPIDLGGAHKDIDFLSFSGHKMHAPKGIGALYMRRGAPCRPFLLGGHQENGRRGGTENVPYIIGLAEACRLASAHMADEGEVARLRDRLEQRLKAEIPHISVHFIEGEGMLYQLSEHGVCASSGSACTSGSLEPSHVLRAMKIPFTAVHGSIRFSLSRYNTEEEVDQVAAIMPEVVANLRHLSPYWDNARNCPRPDAPGYAEIVGTN